MASLFPALGLFRLIRRNQALAVSGCTMAGWASIIWIAPAGPPDFSAVDFWVDE